MKTVNLLKTSNIASSKTFKPVTEIKLGVEVMDILKIASVLDPRFKMKYVTDDMAMKENIVIVNVQV